MSSEQDQAGVYAPFVTRGAVAIPDDQIVDRGAYFEWTEFVADKGVVLSPTDNPTYWAEIGSLGSFTGDLRDYHYYPKATIEKPLRVTGWFVSTSDGGHWAKHYSVGRDGVQVWRTYSTTSDRRAERYSTAELIGAVVSYDTKGYRRVKFSELAAAAREYIMHGQFRAASEHMTWSEDNQHRDTIHSLFALRSTDRGWRSGLSIASWRWQDMKEEGKEFGRLIADMDTDVSDFIEALSGVKFLAPGNLVAAWNNRHDEEVQHCHCGHYEVVGEEHEIYGGSTVCANCFDERVVFAVDVEDYVMRSYAYQHDDGEWYTYDEDDEPGQHPSIKGYYQDVRNYMTADESIVSSPYGDFLMGIELEVVPEDESSHYKCAQDTQNNLCKGYAIMKSDGSLDEGGFEIVTAPRGLAEHIRRFKEWKPNPDLRAWDPGCCGLHVHIDSRAFTQATLGKFIEFINAKENASFIRSIAGRHPLHDAQASDYCQLDGGVVKGNPKKTCECKSVDRYHMVNTTTLDPSESQRLGVPYSDSDKRFNTIELRIFRASLKKERLLAQIEFAHAAVMFCRWSSMRELDSNHFLTWLQSAAGLYPNLAKWFGVRANKTEIEAAPKAQAAADV